MEGALGTGSDRIGRSGTWCSYRLPGLGLRVYDRLGPRTQIIGFQGPNTIDIIIFGPQTLLCRSLDP